MKLFFLSLFFIPYISFAQPLQEFNGDREHMNKKLMIGLGSWATANFIASGIGWATTVPNGEASYFHQMNVMWNTVNIGLAIPGYLKAKKASSTLTFAETVRKQHQTEKIFLINTGFDVGYMASGLILRSEAKSNLEKQKQYNGYGNSLLMQGGFLFLFDLTAYVIHNRHSKKSLDNLMNSIEMSSNGIGLTWHLEPQLFSRNQLQL
jgi:hypothetical protein